MFSNPKYSFSVHQKKFLLSNPKLVFFTKFNIWIPLGFEEDAATTQQASLWSSVQVIFRHLSVRELLSISIPICHALLKSFLPTLLSFCQHLLLFLLFLLIVQEKVTFAQTPRGLTVGKPQRSQQTCLTSICHALLKSSYTSSILDSHLLKLIGHFNSLK